MVLKKYPQEILFHTKHVWDILDFVLATLEYYLIGLAMNKFLLSSLTVEGKLTRKGSNYEFGI